METAAGAGEPQRLEVSMIWLKILCGLIMVVVQQVIGT